MGEISVIIPNFNCSYWLGKCINSCLDQKEYVNEIIVVDDGSTDGSVDVVEKIIKKNGDIVKLYFNSGKGANDARNFGFEQSSGEYIQWLDADDYLLPHKFKTQLETFSKVNCDIVYSDWRMDFYENMELVRVVHKNLKKHSDYLHELLIDNWSCPHNYLIKRETAQFLHSKIAWNPNRKIGQDREYFTIAAIFGAKFEYITGIFTVYNRWSKHSISRTKFSKRIQLNQLLDRDIVKMLTLIYTGKRLRKYLRAMNTHKIKSNFYLNDVGFNKILWPWSIFWGSIHWKMKIAVPWILLKENIKFIKSRSDNN